MEGKGREGESNRKGGDPQYFIAPPVPVLQKNMPGIISDVIDDVTTWLVLDSEPTLSECCYTQM